MNILVTGGAGYVGSILIPDLIKEKHHVKCLDRFFFGKESLSQIPSDNLELIEDDIRLFNCLFFSIFSSIELQRI